MCTTVYGLNRPSDDQRKQKLQKINFILDNPNRQETRLPSKWQQEEAAGRCTLNLRGLFTREIWEEKLVPQHETTTIMAAHFQH